MSTPAIVVRGLSKVYDGLRVVDGIDLCVPRGICFGLLGPNGAGKTTTLRMLLGLTPPTTGELAVLDMPMPEAARAIRARIGIVPQADTLDPDFTVVENLRIYAAYFGLPRPLVEERIEGLLEFARLQDRRDARVESLSGGMKRRLTLARALINAPELVVLDEPTTGLDPQARHLLWGRLEELRARGTTLLLTTHYMEEAERLCDELVVMDHGRILDQGSPRELIARHVEPEVIEVRGLPVDAPPPLDIPADCRVERHGGSLVIHTRDSVACMAQLGGHPGLTVLHRPAGLEDVFLRLTGRELRDG
ncbi:MAG: ATP-binding cassette domain-containing protein [Halothiobacillaceae bacterium]